MNRKDFQMLSTIRLKEAKALLRLGYSDGAYYLAGYAVECALKACIAKRTQRYDFPPRPNTVFDFYKHKPDELLQASGLKSALRENAGRDPKFEIHWRVVAEWSEENRYMRNDSRSASALIEAIEDRNHGVIAWLKHYW